ncbi:MAG TPA: FAD-dependent oxidoreductase [bacterium]|nr:FAD-dependent oxidoreductase [bacterium]
MVAEEEPKTGEEEEPRTGVYVCHCGHNILGMVDVPAVVEDAVKLPGVVVAREYQFMCSDPGQELIKKDIRELGLNRVVVASCSPLMHERTFRRTCAEAGLNPYLFAMANIREHVSWVSEDRELATDKAKQLIHGEVRRVALQEALTPTVVEVTPAALVVGGGIAGIQAALDIADAGKKVYLVEREASIGGHMSVFDKTFPTLDCAACILTPKMVDVGVHPNIELLTYSEVTNVDGFVGNFKVTVKKKARYVDLEKCNSCGDCMEKCPRIPYPSKLIIAIEGTTIKAKKLEEKEKARAAAGE